MQSQNNPNAHPANSSLSRGVHDLDTYRQARQNDVSRSRPLEKRDLLNIQSSLESRPGSTGERTALPPRENASDAVSRRELNAELRVIEERIERRQSEVLHRIDRLGDALSNTADRISADVARIEQDMAGNYRKLDSRIEEMSRDNKSTRNAVWITVVAAFFAAVGLIYASNTTL
jgi:predicted  nucleic acid-binding Zn-ribbon protein